MSYVDYDRFNTQGSRDPFWNESSWFSLSAPEASVHGFIYYFFRPNMNLLVGGPALWDGSGSNCYDCLYYDFSHLQEMPARAEKFNFQAESSLSVEVIEPMQAYHIRYNANGFEADLRWTADGEPQFAHDMEVVSSNESAGVRTHLEQCGRMQGAIRCRDQNYEIDCLSLRDASSGSRKLSAPGRGSYFWGMTRTGAAFHAMTLGGDDKQKAAFGFLRKDGQTARIVSGTRHVIQDGPHLPEKFRLDAEDALGRVMSVTGNSGPALMFNGYPRLQTIWALLSVEIDGGKGWGDIQEFMPLEDFRAKVRLP